MISVHLRVDMAKRSRRLVLVFLVLPLLCTAFIRSSVFPLHSFFVCEGRSQVSHWTSSLGLRSNDTGIKGREFTKFLLSRLLRGRARRDLIQTGVSCILGPNSDICITSNTVKIVTGSSSSSTIYLTAGQRLPFNNSFVVRPYARKADRFAMETTSPLKLLSNQNHLPACDITHTVPAIIFSTGGYAGNIFHDISEVIIPLFLTSGHLQSRVRFVITDFEPWWVDKYRRILAHLSSFDPIIASSPSSPVDNKVHCFPAAVVGLKFHGDITCNSKDAPGVSMLDFRRFLHDSLDLKSKQVAITEAPVLVLISRTNSRMLLNEDEVVEVAEEMGFRVEIATPDRMRKLEEFAELVNMCSALMGVHGAGLTNMVFLPPGAVLLQVVPWGLEWASMTYYGGPPVLMGLEYVEYHIVVEESTLYEAYPKDHPVLVDPSTINKKGHNWTKQVYLDSQNLRLNLTRFRETLLETLQLLPRPSLH